MMHSFSLPLSISFSPIGDTQSVRVSVRPVLNFPVDFYFLLDLSGSLADDLENIKRLSQDISKFCSYM